MKTNNTHLINKHQESIAPAQPPNSASNSIPLTIKLEHLQAAASVAVLGGGITGAYFFMKGVPGSESNAVSHEILETTQQTMLLDSISSKDQSLSVNDMDDEYIQMAENILENTEDPMISFNQEIGFGDAFRDARAELGSGGHFVWEGDTFSTFYKEEWDEMSLENKENYLTKVYQSEDFISSRKYENLEEDVIDIDNAITIDKSHLRPAEENFTEEETEALTYEFEDDVYLDIELEIDEDFDSLFEDH